MGPQPQDKGVAGIRSFLVFRPGLVEVFSLTLSDYEEVSVMRFVAAYRSRVQPQSLNISWTQRLEWRVNDVLLGLRAGQWRGGGVTG